MAIAAAGIAEWLGRQPGSAGELTGRLGEAAIAAGLATFAIRFETHPHPELAGALALAGAMVLGYSSARLEASLGRAAPRTERTLHIMALLAVAGGAAAGQCYWTLWSVAGLTGTIVAARLVVWRVRGVGTAAR
jgi:hypothetical protein